MSTHLRLNRWFVALAGSALSAAGALAQTGADSCASAPLITAGTYSGTTVGATNDGASGCGGADASADVWYKVVPASDRQLIVNSCTNTAYDTVLAIHSGCGPGSVLACNDDACNLQSSVTYNVIGGQTYYIRVAGYGGATGAYSINVSLPDPPPPSPDSCAMATLITPGTYYGTTVGATNDMASGCGSSDTSPDVWFKVVMPDNRLLVAQTCDSTTWDTVLAIHSSCNPGSVLACNDDNCGLQSRVERNALAGETYYIRVAGYGGATGPFGLTVSFQDPPPPPTNGPDVTVDQLIDISYYGTASGINAYAVGTDSCNLGDAPVAWYSGTPFHPVIAQNMYRLKAGRFEQIGMSWLKNGFASTNSPGCTSNCTQPPDGGAQLGVGCADAYGSGLNGSQGNLRPRSDVNAATGEFPTASTSPPYSGVIARRLQVVQTDVDPALNPNALYFVDCQYVTQDDAQWNNGLNNNSYRRIAISGPTATPTFAASTQWQLPAIRAWYDNDANVVLTNFDYTESYTINSQNYDITARFIVGSKVTDNANGTWTYEYAVQNINSHRSGGSFRVPVPAGVTVTNIGFHDVSYHSGEPYDNTDWTSARTADAVEWNSPQTYAQNPNSNALRWSTLYNFRFTADFPPATAPVSIGLFRPGAPSAVQASIAAPSGPPSCDPDYNQDGNADQDDVSYLINVIGGGGNPSGRDPDFTGDGNADQDDVAALVNTIGGGGCP